MSVFSFLKPAEHDVASAAKGTFHFLKDTAVGAINTVKNTADIANAGRQGAQGLFQASVAAATHNQVAESNAVQKTNKAVKSSLKASRGALTPEEAQSGDVVKPIIRNAAAIAPLVIPLGKVAEGASLPMKFLAKSGANAAVGAGGTAATEAVDTGHVNLADVGKSAAAAAALGVAGEAAGVGVKAGIKATVKKAHAYYAGENATGFEDAPNKSVGNDGKPRFEGDDSKATVTRLKPGYNDKLSNVLNHPTLYKDYPQLSDVTVSVQDLPKGGKALFVPERNMIAVSPEVAAHPEQFKSALLHESQHAIQNVEGFPAGTNLQDKAAYNANSGEIEARQVQARANLTPEERMANPIGTPLTPGDLHELTSAKNIQDVHKTLDGKLPPAVIDRVAPAIIHNRDPGTIDNMITRAANPAPKVEVQPPVDLTPPPIVPKEAPKVETVKPDAKAGEQTLRDLANTSNNAEEFHQKLSQLPEDANVRAAMEKSGAGHIEELYQSVKPDPFKDVIDAINGKRPTNGQAGEQGIASARAQQNEILSHERGERFTGVDKLGETEFGSQGYFKRKAALKGEYTKVATPLNDNLDKLTPDEKQALFTDLQKKIYTTPDSVYEKDWKQYGFTQPMLAAGAKFNTEVAVSKVLGLEPGLPTDSEIRLLRVHSPQLADLAEESRPKFHNLMDFASKIFTHVAGVSRALKSTGDFSMGGRQGIFVAARHPVEWYRANKESVKYAGSDQYFKDSMKQIGGDDWIKQFDGYDTGLQGINGGHEEQFSKPDLLTGHVAKDVLKVGNVVAGAERAYTGGLSYLRATLLKSRLMKYGATPEEAAARLGPKGLEGLAEVSRTLTGRGGKTGGWVSEHATSLNEALFSPRLWASRLQVFNPAYWKRIGPAGRAEAFQNLAAFASVAGLVLSAAAATGADVETDPRSSDFLKIKVGDTRYDILGGFQQNLVFGWRELTGEKKSSTTGAVTKFAPNLADEILPGKIYTDKGQVNKTFKGPNRLNIATDLVGNKLTPTLSSAAHIISGEGMGGIPVNPKTEIGQLFVPISIQGTFSTIKDVNSIPEGILKNSPDYFGIGAQTYGVKDLTTSKKQTEYLQKLQKDGAPKDQIAASKLFYQTVKTVPAKTYAYGQIDAALKAGDHAKAEKLAKDYNQQFSKAFDDWRKQYPQYRSDPTLTASYISRQITGDELQSRIDKINQGG